MGLIGIIGLLGIIGFRINRVKVVRLKPGLFGSWHSGFLLPN